MLQVAQVDSGASQTSSDESTKMVDVIELMAAVLEDSPSNRLTMLQTSGQTCCGISLSPCTVALKWKHARVQHHLLTCANSIILVLQPTQFQAAVLSVILCTLAILAFMSCLLPLLIIVNGLN